MVHVIVTCKMVSVSVVMRLFGEADEGGKSVAYGSTRRTKRREVWLYSSVSLSISCILRMGTTTGMDVHSWKGEEGRFAAITTIAGGCCASCWVCVVQVSTVVPFILYGWQAILG